MDRGIDAALSVLLSDELAHVVDMVLCARDGVIQAHAREGVCGFTAAGVAWERGRNPLDRQDASAFSPLDAELWNLQPSNAQNHYPFAYDNAAHLFDDARAPDLAVVHTPAHNWEERGGHRGEHGSLDLVQSRAPLILAGAGVLRRGRIPREARMINVAPALAALAGGQPLNRKPLRAQDGEPLVDILDPSD